jgi:phosphoribosyl 1,2-cyclic phosphodiesterase
MKGCAEVHEEHSLNVSGKSSSSLDGTKTGGKFKVVFIGTGVSTAVPNLGHILADSCDVCRDAHTKIGSKNKRSNVSIAVIFEVDSDSDHVSGSQRKEKCVLIDVGKTMREACLSILPKHGIKEVAAILLTHGHADAILGLDDVRDLQISQSITVNNPAVSMACQCCPFPMTTCQPCAGGLAKDPILTGFRVVSGAMPVYLHQETMDVVQKTFSYLTQSPDYLDETTFVLSRRIALLKFTVVELNESFNVYGLPVRSFPVYHGGRYVCLGFAIGKLGQFVYISDVKIIPDDTMAYLRSIPHIHTLVIDCLNAEGIWSHMGLEEALAVVKELTPTKAYFTGMSCQIGMHADVEADLLKRVPHVHLAFDSLVLQGFDIGS